MGKAVVITGTSTGIGRACAVRMAGAGWTVYAGVRKDADANAVKAGVTGDVRPVLLDVTKDEHITALVSRLGDEVGERGLDGLVNNAGVAEGGAVETVSDRDWRWHFDVNVFGVVNLTRECLPLLRQAHGRVANVGSVGGRTAAPMMAPYSAGKHAIEAISESLRFEVEGFGMKVACIEPGEVATEIWDKADDRMNQVVAALDPEMRSRYDHHLNVMYGFVLDGRKRGIPAAKVADAVYHALTSNRPKHRYLVGPDAKAVGVISRLPDPLRYRMLSFNLNRWAKAGQKARASSA